MGARNEVYLQNVGRRFRGAVIGVEKKREGKVLVDDVSVSFPLESSQCSVGPAGTVGPRFEDKRRFRQGPGLRIFDALNYFSGEYPLILGT